MSPSYVPLDYDVPKLLFATLSILHKFCIYFCGYILFTKRKVCKKWLNMRWPSWHLCVLTSRLCHCQDLTNLISLTLKHIKQKKYGTNTSKCGQFSRNSADFCFSILLELQRTVGHLLQICVVHLRHLRQAKISQLS